MNEEQDTQYEFEATVICERYFNEDSSWGVYVIDVDKDKFNIPHLTEYKTFEDFDVQNNKQYQTILAGNTVQLFIGQKYKVTARLKLNSKYRSWQYEPISVISTKPKTQDEQQKFLESIVTKNQAKTLIENYPNIVDDIINGTDNVDISKLHGIGEPTYVQIKNKILDNFVISDILVLLQPLGITFNMIKKLLREEPNPALLKQKLIDNPYIMTKIKGFGFKTVDTLALKLNPNIRLSKQRTYAFITYYLKDVGENVGHTWVRENILESAVIDNINECIDIYHDIIKLEKQKNVILYFEDDKVGLAKYHELESNIFNILVSLNNYDKSFKVDIEDGIQEAEKEQGFNFSEEQNQIINKAFENNVTVISGRAGCVDCDTEFFNGVQWKKISEYKIGDQVLQYNKNGIANLVNPIAYIKQPCRYLNHMINKKGTVDQVLSDHHTVIYKSSKGNLNSKKFYDIKNIQKNNKRGFQGRFYTTFNYSGTGINLTDEQIRVMVAVIADGHFNKQNSNWCCINIKKERKINRIESLLKNAHITYSKKENVYGGYNRYFFYAPRKERKFTSFWYDCNHHQLEIIIDEILNWDGRILNRQNENRCLLQSFSSTSKQTIDFVQFALASCNIRSTIEEDNRIGQIYKTNKKEYTRKNIYYTLNISTISNTLGIAKRHIKTQCKIENYKTKDGFEYCFTVPSHMLVLRRNGKIFITGNCGKTSISRAILKIYKNANYRIGACALSAKAAQRITEATGFPASTIHRMLSWQGEEGFAYNHFNPLPYDVILLDEASMVNVPIFYALLSAIKEGSRVIVCGDDKQLPPIGYGNVFGDLIQKTDVFNVNQLTHVHRQAEKSGILSDANKIREGIYPIKQPELKIVSGELKDMVYMFRDNREALRNLAIKTYLKSIQEDGIDNVVIITPRKQNCINSTAEINRLIQNALISKDTEYMKYGDKIFKLGSKVIQRENNYDKNVFNGEIGYITKIWNEGKITKFRVNYKMNNETKTIDYTKNELDQIDLAYAMTVHLCVPKNTYIYTNKGLIEIDKLNNTKNEFEYNPIKSDIKVFNGYNLEQPSYFYNAGKSECKTIKTGRGFELTATLNHGVNVINQNFEIIRKDMNKLTTNDFVLLRYGQNIFGNIKEIPKQYFNIEVDVRANKYNLPKVLTKDFARFLGYIVADGTIYEKGFRYSKRDLSTVQDFKRVTDSIFGTNYNIIPQHNKYEYTINSTQISKFLFNIGGMCPHNKYVPDIILQSSKEMQCEFLKSVFEDGTVNVKNGIFDHVELVMINKKMKKQIALMLLNMGIKTTLYTTTKKIKNGTDTIYHIYIYKQDAILFEKYIGFICDRKNNNLHLCNQKTYCCPCKSFPYLKEILICIAKKYNLPLQKAGVYKLTNNITYNMFNRFYNSNDVLKQDDKMNNIKNIIDKFDVQQIVNITSSIQDTVCITMPQTHQFIQDGFYGWNCQGSGFKTVIVIIDNTHYTLLDTCLLYTAITRAKKRCLLVAEPSAFKKCLNTNKSIIRQTWLKDMTI